METNATNRLFYRVWSAFQGAEKSLTKSRRLRETAIFFYSSTTNKPDGCMQVISLSPPLTSSCIICNMYFHICSAGEPPEDYKKNRPHDIKVIKEFEISCGSSRLNPSAQTSPLSSQLSSECTHYSG